MLITGNKIVCSVFAGDQPAKTLRNHTLSAVRFLREFSPLFSSYLAASFCSAVQGVIFAAISPRVFVLFSQCGFRGSFQRRFRREFSHFFALRFQGSFQLRFCCQFSHLLGGHFSGDFAASTRTFFALRFQGVILAAISPRVFALLSQCDFRWSFQRRFCHQ